MSKFPIMSFRWIFQLLNKLWVFFSYLCNKQFRKVIQYQPVKYDLYPLSPGSLHNRTKRRWTEWEIFNFSFATSSEFGPAENACAGSGRNTHPLAPRRASSEPHHQARNPSRLYRKFCSKNQFSFNKNLFTSVSGCLWKEEETKIEAEKLSLYLLALAMC